MMGTGATFRGLVKRPFAAARKMAPVPIFLLLAAPVAGDPSLSAGGLVSTPGTRTYQAWYRNAAPFCTAATFNLTNGVEIVWTN